MLKRPEPAVPWYTTVFCCVCFTLKDTRKRWMLVTLFALFISYYMFALCRVSLDVALPSMLDDKFLGTSFNKEAATRMFGIALICVFIGKIVFMFTTDKLGGRLLFFGSLFFICISTALVGFCSYLGVIFPSLLAYNEGIVVYSLMTTFWCIDKFFMAGIWPAIVPIVCNWFPKSRWGTIFGIMTLSSRIGNTLGTLFLGGIVTAGMTWRWVFFVAPVCTFLASFFYVFIIKNTPEQAGFTSNKPAADNSKAKTNIKTKVEKEKFTVHQEADSSKFFAEMVKASVYNLKQMRDASSDVIKTSFKGSESNKTLKGAMKGSVRPVKQKLNIPPPPRSPVILTAAPTTAPTNATLTTDVEDKRRKLAKLAKGNKDDDKEMEITLQIPSSIPTNTGNTPLMGNPLQNNNERTSDVELSVTVDMPPVATDSSQQPSQQQQKTPEDTLNQPPSAPTSLGVLSDTNSIATAKNRKSLAILPEIKLDELKTIEDEPENDRTYESRMSVVDEDPSKPKSPDSPPKSMTLTLPDVYQPQQTNENPPPKRSVKFDVPEQQPEQTDGDAPAQPPVEEPKKSEHPLNDAGVCYALAYFLLSPRVWAICFSQICATMIMEFGAFFTLYLKEVKQLNSGLASTASSIFGVGTTVSVLVGGYIYDISGRVLLGRTILMLILTMSTTACAVILWIFPDLNVGVVLALYFILGMSVSPVYNIPMGLFSGQYGGPKHCGKLSSLIEAVSVCISAVAYFAGGIVLQRFGWNAFFIVITASSVLGIVAMCLFQLLEVRARVIERRNKPAVAPIELPKLDANAVDPKLVDRALMRSPSAIRTEQAYLQRLRQHLEEAENQRTSPSPIVTPTDKPQQEATNPKDANAQQDDLLDELDSTIQNVLDAVEQAEQKKSKKTFSSLLFGHDDEEDEDEPDEAVDEEGAPYLSAAMMHAGAMKMTSEEKRIEAHYLKRLHTVIFRK